jgi:hypothetical protein
METNEQVITGAKLVLPVKIFGIYCDGQEKFADCTLHFDKAAQTMNGLAVESSNTDFSIDSKNKGIYLSWELPAALRKGDYNQDTDETTFLPAFNRWYLIRLVKNDDAWAVKTIVIESDYLSSDNKESSVSLLLEENEDDLKCFYLGRAYEYQTGYQPSSGDESIKLTAVGNGDPFFNASQPASDNVFGYFDSLEDLEALTEDTEIHYMLIGFYSNLEDDLFGKNKITTEALDKIGFSIDDDENGNFLNEGTLAQGFISIKCTTSIKQTDASELKISIGNTSVEAISAGINPVNDDSKLVTGSEYSGERMLQLFLHNRLTEAASPDTILLDEKTLHDREFSTIQVDEIYGFSDEIKNSSNEITKFTTEIKCISDDINNKSPYVVLNEINACKRSINCLEHQIDSYRHDCYYLWQFYHEVMNDDSLSDKEKDERYEKYNNKLEILASQIKNLMIKRNFRLTNLQDKINSFNDEIKSKLILINDEPFYLPNNPTVMFSGVESAKNRLNADDTKLTCRIDNQLLYSSNLPSFKGSYDVKFDKFIREAIIIFDSLTPERGVMPDSSCICKNDTEMEYPYLIWNLNYYHDDDLTDWKLEGEDFLPAENKELKEKSLITGRSYLTAQIDYVLKEAFKRYCKIKNSEKLSFAMLDTSGNISQTLGTFNEQLARHKTTILIPISERQSDSSNDKGSDYHYFVDSCRKLIGDECNQVEIPDGSFTPIRAGKLELDSLTLVDRYGRTYDIDATNASISEALKNDAGEIILPPRLLQPSRLLIELKESEEASNQCVIGWLRFNKVNQSLVLNDYSGAYLGELKLIEGKVSLINTRSSSNGTYSYSYLRDENNPSEMESLIKLIEGMGEAFSDLLKVVETRQDEMLDSPSSNSNSIFIGRPLAVVPADIKLEIMGNPLHDPEELRCNTEVSNKLTDLHFTLKLGDHNLTNDGLVGFFLDDSFCQEIIEINDSSDNVFHNNEIEISIDEVKHVLMLMNVQLETSLVSGILPRRTIKLDSSKYKRIEDNLTCSFQVGPMIQPADSLIADLPKLPNTNYYLDGEMMVLKNDSTISDNVIREGFVDVVKVRASEN